MQSRRDFVKNAALLSGALGAFKFLPESLARAIAIDPQPGSSWEDAEHVVILMQENRSFDHVYGALQGVRGFNDPRAIALADGLPVWCQTGSDGRIYTPFRLDIHNSRSTWTGCLDHGRGSQVAAFNRGKHDRWLLAKHPFGGVPLTLGHYDRRDIPFYYAFADAFTVCDQHFCSAQTCTTPNRCYLWSGTSRGAEDKYPRMDNGQLDHNTHPKWTTFPERLQDLGISWQVYQNEVDFVSAHYGGERDEWLGNYGDNPLEYFLQYRVRFSQGYQTVLKAQAARLKASITRLEAASAAATSNEESAEKLGRERLQAASVEKLLAEFSPEAFSRLTARDRALHERAFATNRADPNQYSLESLAYHDGKTERTLHVPKGDIFHQFRRDVETGALPTVSWLVAPQKCSDHPASAWYGAWYVSEALDILTRNPEVWKKTIFILTYDENDGYFDHVPPFVPPHVSKPATGSATPGVDTEHEFDQYGHPIGLGYRVPMVVASPWSRGGRVNSQVFDHTSVLQFLERFLSKKTGGAVHEPNISSWRRAICGDLTSVFSPARAKDAPLPKPVDRNPFVAGIHRAYYRPNPTSNSPLTATEVEALRKDPKACRSLPKQEPGTRASCPLPYELCVTARYDRERQAFGIEFEAGNKKFGGRAAGAPFNVYAPGKYAGELMRMWSYAVEAGRSLQDEWPLSRFESGLYHLRVHGPNGFYREFQGDANDPALTVACEDEIIAGKPSGNLLLKFANRGEAGPIAVHVVDRAYGAAPQTKTVAQGASETIVLDLQKSFHWHDFSVTVAENANFLQRFAGRVETGDLGVTDPSMA